MDKTALRRQIRAQKQAMTPAEIEKTSALLGEKLRAHPVYQQAKSLYGYLSYNQEVRTLPILKAALADGKRVACPRCIEGTREMEFYYIRSLDDLEKRTFGVLEPRVPGCEKLEDYTGSLCIVPALMYDLKGYRLGYGGGYYDRFLAGYTGCTIGLTYRPNILRFLHYGRFDVPVDMVVTEDFFRLTSRSRARPSGR